jgi:alcohol dehydrogenase (cytochrome c)
MHTSSRGWSALSARDRSWHCATKDGTQIYCNDWGTGRRFSAMVGGSRHRKLCPSMSGGNHFWPASYSRRAGLLYVTTSMSSCKEVTRYTNESNMGGDWKGASFRDTQRNETDADPFTGEVRKKLHSLYPNSSGVLSTGGGVIFTGYTDGTFAAFDDTTLDELWKINVGTGFAAPPMTFEVGGKQYVAILSGLSRASRSLRSARDPDE